MVMCYFKWSGVLAIRTMKCIPMLFLYDTLYLYYTLVGLLAWLLILLPYVDPVCWLCWLLSSSLLTSSSSCTAATLTNWIFFSFCSMPHLLLVSFYFWIQSQISVLHLTVGPDAPLHVADCIVSLHSLTLPSIFFCPGFVYFALAGSTLLGMALSPCFIYSTSCFHGSW